MNRRCMDGPFKGSWLYLETSSTMWIKINGIVGKYANMVNNTHLYWVTK